MQEPSDLPEWLQQQFKDACEFLDERRELHRFQMEAVRGILSSPFHVGAAATSTGKTLVPILTAIIQRQMTDLKWRQQQEEGVGEVVMRQEEVDGDN